MEKKAKIEVTIDADDSGKLCSGGCAFFDYVEGCRGDTAHCLLHDSGWNLEVLEESGYSEGEWCYAKIARCPECIEKFGE